MKRLIRRQLAIRLLVLGVSVFVFVLMGEAFLWIVSPISYHTAPEWQQDGHIRGRWKPHQTYQTGPGHNPLAPIRHETHINQINRFGFRGEEYSLEPNDDVVRIIVFGGSAAFSFHDPEDATWPQLLGDCLESKLGVETEVLNLALPGFTLGISKINYLVNGRALNPDIAIAYHTWNDLKTVGLISINAESLLVSPVARPEGLLLRQMRWLSRYSQLVRRGRIVVHRLQGTLREGTEVEETGWEASALARDWFSSNFSDFARMALADGVVPVLATQATLVAEENLSSSEIAPYIADHLVKLPLKSLLVLWQWANGAIVEVAKEHDIPVADLYAKVPHTLTYLEDHVHMTPDGQVMAAEIFCSTMAESDRVRAVYSSRESGRPSPPGLD